MRKAVLVAALTFGLASLTAAGTAAQAPVRDAAPARPTGKPGTVSGTITAAENERPLHRVKLTLTGPTPNPLTALTNDRGQYEFRDVPPGTYSLTVARAGYLTLQYGQRRPREAGRPIEVKTDVDLTQVDAVLSRGAVVAGRILDELGDPYPGVRVEALESRFVNGRRIAVPAALDTTDDLGEYRISGLLPGRYTVRAFSTETWQTDGALKETLAYTPTYYPGANAERAEAIPLAVGQEAANIDFSMVAGRTFKVSGRAEGPTGQALPNQPVSLGRVTRTIGGALMSTSAGFNGRTSADGAFTIPNVSPGEYVLSTTTGTAESAMQTVFVTEGDLTDLVLTSKKETSLKGKVVSDENAPLPFGSGRLRILTVPVGDRVGLPLVESEAPEPLLADYSFDYTGIFGQYLFRVVGLPDDWLVQSVTLGGVNLTDSPVDVQRGTPMSDMTITVSRKAGGITGAVVDGRGAPLLDNTVVAFTEDATKWGPGSRFVKAVRPDQSGKFNVLGLPAGTYLVAARDFIVEGEWDDPALLQSLREEARRVTVVEGARQEITLRVEAK